MPAEPFDHEYPPASWSAEALAESLRSTDPDPAIPAFEDADEWASIRDDSACEPVVSAIVDEAETVRETDVPAYPASLYLDYARVDGISQREVMQPTLDRARRLGVAALAECFERDGRFEDAVLDQAWALCEQATWLHPANLSDEEDVDGLPVSRGSERRNVALRPADVAKALGELDYVFGDRLHPALRERIREAVETRVLEPYEARDDFWWQSPPANNWNAVCNGGSAVAATYLLDDPDRVAAIAVKAARNLRHYVNAFGPDGCTPEGIGYWNYGLGSYVQFSERLESLTGGEYSLLSPPVVSEIARFPLRVELSPHRYPQFSDATPGAVDPFVACWLGDRLDIPGLAALGRDALTPEKIGRFPDTLRHLHYAAQTPADLGLPTPDRSVHLAGHDWWIARADPGNPDGLVVAAKGGHNGESHNHNDVGSFVVHARRESLLTDLGAPVYDNEYWDTRYEFLAARSLGHPVPYVNGCEQAAGREHAGAVLDGTDNGDRATFELELADCYPEEAGLASLRRTFALERAEGARLTVEDEAEFRGTGSFETVLVSYHPLRVRDDDLVATGDRGEATVVPEIAGEIAVEHLEDAIDKTGQAGFDGAADVWRARLDTPGEDAATATTRYAVRLD